MEIFIISFLIIILSCAGLAAGQWFGGDPIKGSCRPAEGSDQCAHADTCSGQCALRSLRKSRRGS